jgi:hypothetical protein
VPSLPLLLFSVFGFVASWHLSPPVRDPRSRARSLHSSSGVRSCFSRRTEGNLLASKSPTRAAERNPRPWPYLNTCVLTGRPDLRPWARGKVGSGEKYRGYVFVSSNELLRSKSLPVSVLASRTALVQRLVEALVYGLVDALVQQSKWSSPPARQAPYFHAVGIGSRPRNTR